MFERIMILTALIGIFLIASISDAGEVDHFSARSDIPFGFKRTKKMVMIGNGSINFYKQSWDSSQILNGLTNEALNKAVRDYDLQSRKFTTGESSEIPVELGCDKRKFARIVGESFLHVVLRQFTEKSFDRKINIFNPQRSETIYKDLNISNGPVYAGEHEDDIISGMIRIGPHHVGSDKLDHFFEFGDYMYSIAGDSLDLTAPKKYVWEPIVLKNFGIMNQIKAMGILVKYRSRSEGSLSDALDFSMKSEIGAFGISSNGIMSYADLMANYKGFLFYQSFFAEKDPYFTCENGTIARTERQFDWLEHIDDAWDESINCNKYGSLEIESKVNERIFDLGFNACPVVEESCKNLGKKYKNRQEYVLNPSCHSQD